MSDNNMEESNNRPPCAACKYQRKKCMPDCILRKHFPSNLAEDFKAVHNVFGISNVKKLLEKVGVPQQDEVAKSITWEAKMWDQDPVQGPYGCCMKLKQELEELKQEQRNNQRRQSQIMNQPRPPQDINSYLHWNVGNQQLGGLPVFYLQLVQQIRECQFNQDFWSNSTEKTLGRFLYLILT
ncbi:Lob domain-containing protein 2 [Forsythia ovata]|uniref:Lob domain-containing protein 2 n=1 Tax=Forsythia ovata TaxID=205694 RepID=A0ABD1S2K8_9LAMI